MVRETRTSLWNDSASPSELSQSIAWGATGATCNPAIALAVLRADVVRWRARARELAAERPVATESELGWALVRELSIEAAALLYPAFRDSRGREGRLSIQTDPRLHRDTGALVDQAVEFSALAPNMIVKIPATELGITAMEEATYRGVTINATVSFTLPQALAVGEAVERGLRRREAEGLDVTSMGPVCTLMVGRLDDWLKAVVSHEGPILDPGHLEWAGIAVFKKAYRIYQERGYRARLLSAAFRNHMHWSQLIGGDVVISPPFAWQRRLNGSGIEPVPRMDDPVDPGVLDELNRIAEFRRAYAEDGMTPAEFDRYGATVRTLRQFLAATGDLEEFVRDAVLPEPLG
jgi:transaldolase